jgi:hypothetical protein
MENVAWFSLRRCLSRLARLSLDTSMSCTSTGRMAMACCCCWAVVADDLPNNPNFGMDDGMKEENMVLLCDRTTECPLSSARKRNE